MKNYYAILGIRQNATDRDIKEAYKKMCYTAEKFSDIWEAYKVLSDAEKRANYDNQIMKQDNPTKVMDVREAPNMIELSNVTKESKMETNQKVK